MFAGNTAGLENFRGSYAKLSSGHDIPLLGWGSFQASADEAELAVQEALRAGFQVRAPVFQHSHAWATHQQSKKSNKVTTGILSVAAY